MNLQTIKKLLNGRISLFYAFDEKNLAPHQIWVTTGHWLMRANVSPDTLRETFTKIQVSEMPLESIHRVIQDALHDLNVFEPTRNAKVITTNKAKNTYALEYKSEAGVLVHLDEAYEKPLFQGPQGLGES